MFDQKQNLSYTGTVSYMSISTSWRSVLCRLQYRGNFDIGVPLAHH